MCIHETIRTSSHQRLATKIMSVTRPIASSPQDLTARRPIARRSRVLPSVHPDGSGPGPCLCLCLDKASGGAAAKLMRNSHNVCSFGALFIVVYMLYYLYGSVVA